MIKIVQKKLLNSIKKRLKSYKQSLLLLQGLPLVFEKILPGF